MSKSFWISGRSGGEIHNDNLTRYFPVGTDPETEASEVHVEIDLREAVAISDLTIRITDNTLTGNADYTVRKDSVDTAITVQFASTDSDTEKTDSTSVDFASGTTVSIEGVAASGGTSIVITNFLVAVEPDTSGNTISLFQSMANATSSLSAGETRWITTIGQRNQDNAEDDVHFKTPIAGTVKGFSITSGTNSLDQDTIYVLRKSGADMNPTLTFTASDDNTFKQDTTNESDTIAADDQINVDASAAAGTGASQVKTISFFLVNTADTNFVLASYNDPVRISFGETDSRVISGFANKMASEVEADTKISVPFACDAVELRSWSFADTIDGDVDVTLRKEGADTALSINWVSTDGEQVKAATGSVAYAAGDDINYQFIAQGTTGRRDFRYTYVTLAETVAAVAGSTLTRIEKKIMRGVSRGIARGIM